METGIGIPDGKVQFKPNTLIVNLKYSGGSKDDHMKGGLLDEPAIYNGFLSQSSKKEVKKALDNWLTGFTRNEELKISSQGFDSAQSLYSFIILTLPSKQIHTDQAIKKECFLFFLDWLSAEYGIKNHFWGTGRQENGNIQFHLVVDKFVYWDLLRTQWNLALEKLGYISRYRSTMLEVHKDGFSVDGQRLGNDLASFRRIVDRFNANGKIPKKCNVVLFALLKDAKSKNLPVTEDHIMLVAEKTQLDAYYFGQSENWSNPNATSVTNISRHLDKHFK